MGFYLKQLSTIDINDRQGDYNEHAGRDQKIFKLYINLSKMNQFLHGNGIESIHMFSSSNFDGAFGPGKRLCTI